MPFRALSRWLGPARGRCSGAGWGDGCAASPAASGRGRQGSPDRNRSGFRQPAARGVRLQARMVADQLATIEVLPSIAGPADCGAIDLVKLREIVLPDKTRVTVIPAPTLRCEMAEAVTHWVREDVLPEISKLGSTLQALDNYDFVRMPRAQSRGRREDQRAWPWQCPDVRGMKMANGKFADLTDRHLPRSSRSDKERVSAIVSRPCSARIRTAITRATSISTSPSGATITGCANGRCSIRCR